MTIINRKCPFCSDFSFGVEKWNTNLYLLKCVNSNTSAARWVKLAPNGMFAPVATQSPRQKPPQMSSYDKQSFDKLQVPFWKLMGQRPKAKDIAYERYLKLKGMTYGDAVLERNMNGSASSAYDAFQAEAEGRTKKTEVKYGKKTL